MTSSEFDYVIVGGGTAGCVVAARLSQDPAVSVCLLEAGPSDVGDDQVLQLERWIQLLGSSYDWDYPVEPQERGNSFLRHSRARVLGGCSSHNSAIAFWAPGEDLDEWGLPGWSAADCFPLYRRLENNDAPGNHHGRTGPVRIRSIPARDPCGAALLAACAQSGIPTVEFNSGATVIRGANWFQLNAREDGVRSSASVSYLHPMLDRANLAVRTGAWVQQLTFDGRRCTGAEYLTPDLAHSRQVTARREVVLSAGSIDSPKLLMLSGIGPAQHLRDVGVDVVLDAPGVGENLQDHPEGIVQWATLAPLPARSTQSWEIGIFTARSDRVDRPEVMLHYGATPFDLHTRRCGYPTPEHGFCLTPNVTRARSTGTVRLRSGDFRDKPRVDPRYFTDPYDEQVMLYGVRLAREIAAQPALAGWVGRELAPGLDAQSDDELIDYVHRTHNTVYHPSCTVPMGAGPMGAGPMGAGPMGAGPMGAGERAPLDARLRVKGIDGLRVADGSAMPFLVAVNPCLTTMMIGEKCADMIREDAR